MVREREQEGSNCSSRSLARKRAMMVTPREALFVTLRKKGGFNIKRRKLSLCRKTFFLYSRLITLTKPPASEKHD